MNCEDLNEALVDLVDGRLDGAGQRTVERHLEGCGNCRALVEDLRSIRAAAFMLDRREPTAAQWSKLQTAIAAEPAAKARVLGFVRLRQGVGAQAFEPPVRSRGHSGSCDEGARRQPLAEPAEPGSAVR